MKNKIIDLFCGCGGLSLGFEMAGFESALAIDLWKDAIVTYNHNRKNKVGICEDIHNLTDEYLESLNKDEEIIGVIGGPPCQGYSTVGTRDINDPRNHLYMQYCRVVEKVRPKFFVLENVKGLTTLMNGMFRDDIYNRFGALLNIKQNTNETDEQYRSRLKVSVTALLGGTKEAVKYAVASGLGVNNDQEAMDRIHIYDAWDYPGEANVIKEYGYVVCDIDLNQGIYSIETEAVVTETVNNAKATGVSVQLVFRNFRIVYYIELDNVTYISLDTLNYNQVGE